MISDGFFAEYRRFSTESKEEGTALLGADYLVGDRLAITFTTKGHRSVAWLENRFGGRVGYLDDETSHRLSVFSARGWKLAAVLSFVAYTDTPEPGRYWGEVALVCYDRRHESAFDGFLSTVGSSMLDGTHTDMRPRFDYSESELQRIVDSGGSWIPSARIPLPKLPKGSAFIKKDRSLTDKMVELGRSKNPGCYIVSWAFIIVVVLGVFFLAKSCVGA